MNIVQELQLNNIFSLYGDGLSKVQQYLVLFKMLLILKTIIHNEVQINISCINCLVFILGEAVYLAFDVLES